MGRRIPRRQSSTQSSEPPAAPKPEGEVVAEFIESFCRLSKGDGAGELIRLRPWQREILNEIFAHREDGRRKYRRGLLLMPRKNGKSLVSAGIALYSLFTEIGAEVGLVAGDRAQARIVFRECARMVELDPILSRKLHVMRDVIEYPETGSVLRVLSSDGSRAEGYNFSTVVFDEVHVQPDDRLWSTVNLGSGARKNPLVLGISTAGSKTDSRGQDSLCFRLWQYGMRIQSGEIADDAFFFRYFTAPEDLPWDSPEAAKAANPAYGDFLDPEDFAAAARSLPREEYETKRLCRWVSQKTSWLPAGSWEQLGTDRRLQDGEKVVLSFDGSYDGDCSVLLAASLDGHVEPLLLYERPIDDPHWKVDIGQVEADILEVAKRFTVLELAADPFRWARSLEAMEREGIPLVHFPQSPSRMVAACQSVFEAVSQGQIHWGGDARLTAALTRHLDNARVKVDRFGPRIVKEHRGSARKIDLAVAMVMAWDRARYYASEAAKPATSVEFISL